MDEKGLIIVYFRENKIFFTALDFNNNKKILIKILFSEIQWNETWGSQLHLGQVSAVSIDPNGNIAIFHRGSRVWDGGSFNGKDEFDFNNNCGPVKEPTIILLDKNGEEIFHWGSGIFYMPHGLTIDHLGNYWITDVAMHQVFKFDVEDIMKIRNSFTKDTKHQHSNNEGKLEKCADLKNSFNNSIIKPSLKLGVPFVPGNDNEKFCKPTSVAVMKNGDFFVADGYCNSRVIKFNSKGERILTWGRSNRLYGNYEFFCLCKKLFFLRIYENLSKILRSCNSFNLVIILIILTDFFI